MSAGGQRRPPLRRVARSACVRADVGIGPYGSVTRNAPQVLAGGVDPRPYGGIQGVREKNPPVAASP